VNTCSPYCFKSLTLAPTDLKLSTTLLALSLAENFERILEEFLEGSRGWERRST
jgi:hypothetical protein